MTSIPKNEYCFRIDHPHGMASADFASHGGNGQFWWIIPFDQAPKTFSGEIDRRGGFVLMTQKVGFGFMPRLRSPTCWSNSSYMKSKAFVVERSVTTTYSVQNVAARHH